jgi:hypothetical protein
MASETTYDADERGSRELDARESEGLRVRLLWDPIADAVTVAVDDLRAGDRFRLTVARDRALDAFHHRSLTPPDDARWRG